MACSLEKYLQVYNYMLCILASEKLLQNRDRNDILSCTTLAMPVFHAYGHKPECQVCLFDFH